MAKVDSHKQVVYELRKDLAEALKIKFEDIKKTCDKYNICMKCWDPLPNGVYICHCDNDL